MLKDRVPELLGKEAFKRLRGHQYDVIGACDIIGLNVTSLLVTIRLRCALHVGSQGNNPL